jgi:hypothetical protein
MSESRMMKIKKMARKEAMKDVEDGTEKGNEG